MFPSSNSETTATHGEHPKNRGKSSIAGWHAVQVMRKRCLRTIVSIWCSWNMYIYIYITITVYLWNICCSHTKNLEESSNEAVLDSCPGNWLVISSIRTCSDMIYIYIFIYSGHLSESVLILSHIGFWSPINMLRKERLVCKGLLSGWWFNSMQNTNIMLVYKNASKHYTHTYYSLRHIMFPKHMKYNQWIPMSSLMIFVVTYPQTSINIFDAPPCCGCFL
jgi:hypothetical protein